MAPDAAPRRSKSERGYLTLTALSLTTVIGISLASYISLCYQSYLLSFRLFQVAQCRQLAETGLEEALWALNNNNWTSAGPAGAPVTWTFSGSTATCTVTGYQLGEGVTGQVLVTVANYNCPFNPPPAPAPSPTPVIAAIATVRLPTGTQLTKTLRAPFQPAPLFANAVGVTNVSGGYVLFTSGGSVDSWDSNLSGFPYSPGSTPSNYAATLAAPGTSNGIILNSAAVHGYAATFGAGISHGGSTLQGPTSGSTFDSSRVSTSAFVPSFPVAAPSGAYDSTTLVSPLTSGTITLGVVGATVPTQYYIGSTLQIQNAGTELVVQGPVVIWVAGNLLLWYAAKIHVLDTGRLEMVVAGNDIQIGGAAGSIAQFQNDTNDPKNLALYSTHPGPRTFVYNSTQDFCGVMYSAAQRYEVRFQTSPNIYGAILANFNVIFDSGTTPQVHYDLALRKLPKNWFKAVTTPYMLLQITET
jgi:hypothetical protein